MSKQILMQTVRNVCILFIIIMIAGNSLTVGNCGDLQLRSKPVDFKVPDALRSVRKNSLLTIGGELFTDYIGRIRTDGGVTGTRYQGGWAVHNSNLRFDFSVTEELHVKIKFDMSSDCDGLNSGYMEEALAIWDNVCGGPVGIFFGKGEVPYGQDRTLGIIQSYNHTEGGDSSEGPIILNYPLYGSSISEDDIIYHPGEIDRVVMAGINLAWQDILRFEFAFFQPNDLNSNFRNYNELLEYGDTGIDSFAGRLWWNTPVDGLIAEISGVRKHLKRRGDNGLFGSDAIEDEYAVSAGAEWLVTDELEFFTEYQHGFNWGFKDGYNTDTVSLGGLYDITERISLGAMTEWLHIAYNGTDHDFNKFVLHSQYSTASGFYLIAEYGLELYNWGSGLTNMFAFRTGIRF